VQISFNKASLTGNEIDYILDAVNSGHISGDGNYSKKCQKLLCEVLGTSSALLTTSCTDALEMAAILLNITPGDEVLFPSYTFVSTVNAFVLMGAVPVFVDIRRDTLNIDEKLISEKITARTKAIVVVHYAGVSCEMDTILEIAKQRGIHVVEDNAHGLFGKYKGKYLGTFGCLATQSFHETKNFTCGEGGALLINDQSLIERAEIIRDKGTNRSKFYRGQVDKYTWVDVGSSYLPSDILSAFLLAQLENSAAIQMIRNEIWDYYFKALYDWSQSEGVTLPFVPTHCDQAFHMFYLILPSEALRDKLILFLKEAGIYAVFHYLPLHLSPMGVRFGGMSGDCPVTEDISSRIIRLPFYNGITKTDLAYITDMVKKFTCS